MKHPHNLETLRHSCAHLLAKAVLELWPGSHNAIGPAIDNGFYQDFDMGEVKISEEDFPKIEKEMRRILPNWKHFEYREVSLDEAKKLFKHNPYKIELATEFAGQGKKLTVNNPGDFLDLCKMTHVDNPVKEMQHFKLLSIAGAYWKGSEENKMLTRIYGTVWPTKKELEKHLWQLEEAKRRDHKKLGQELELFMFHETSPGMPYWLPKGLTILNELLNFWRADHARRGYQEISTPLIADKKLWETSGHWEFYKEHMFLIPVDENAIYGLKPMNCPNAMVVFSAKTRSYRDLPLRLSDTDVLHRLEKSGTLNGLLRARKFQQDDAHIFITEDQIEEEFKNVLEIAEDFYLLFGLDYRLRLGTRPEKFMGDQEVWDKAEASLKKILEGSGREHFVFEGDGTFYGPKIDILMKDTLGREWQMGTIQLDFQLPQRFNLKYQDADGQEKTPVVIHRVIYGSLERFIGILIEHFAGSFPVWLSPVQAIVLPITDRNTKYAQELLEKLQEAGIRAEIDTRSETLQAKIRDAQLAKVPYMLIVGDREEKEGSVSLRLRGGEDLGKTTIDKFLEQALKAIKSRSLDL